MTNKDITKVWLAIWLVVGALAVVKIWWPFARWIIVGASAFFAGVAVNDLWHFRKK